MMSVLIDELEARKNDYILVANVINLMAEATSSEPYDVIKYLDAHDVDEHLMMFYMTENYQFEPQFGFLAGLGKDAQYTYFLKSQVASFEPITKHGVFDGGTYDANQHIKNRDDEYLTVNQAISLLEVETSSPHDCITLRELARKKKITPCFYFSGYLCKLKVNEIGNLTVDMSVKPYTDLIVGYFTFRLLTEKIVTHDDYIKVPYCQIGNEIKIHRIIEAVSFDYLTVSQPVALFEERPQEFIFDDSKLALSYIDYDEIRFSKKEIDAYIKSVKPISGYSFATSLQNNDALVKELESLKIDNADLNSRLAIARQTFKQQQNEINALKEQLKQTKAESIGTPADGDMLQTILDDSHEHHAPDLKHAINLWADLYIKGDIKDDSHSNRAAYWISKNTKYSENAKTSTDRIKEISSPSRYWSPHRKKENLE